MFIDIHADAHLHAGALPLARIRETLELTLRALSTQIVRAEIQLGQSPRMTERDQQRCSIEARLRGGQPLLVEHQAASLDQAVDGALANLGRVIDGAGARARDRMWSTAPASVDASGQAAAG